MLVIGDKTILEATVTNDTNIYADLDQLGELITIANAFSGTSFKGSINSVTVIDAIKQKSAFRIFFFDEAPTIASSDNAALNITDAEMADKCIGKIEIAAADYKDLAANSVATVSGLNLIVKSKSTSLFCLCQSGGTPTYTSVDALTLKIGLTRG
jgi:hypothetical protein